MCRLSGDPGASTSGTLRDCPSSFRDRFTLRKRQRCALLSYGTSEKMVFTYQSTEGLYPEDEIFCTLIFGYFNDIL
jgi:hypothetical protein